MKLTVHNELEAKVLIEEAFSRGTEEDYQDAKVYTHSGEFLFKVRIELVGYWRDMPNGDSWYKEL